MVWIRPVAATEVRWIRPVSVRWVAEWVFRCWQLALVNWVSESAVGGGVGVPVLLATGGGAVAAVAGGRRVAVGGDVVGD